MKNKNKKGKIKNKKVKINNKKGTRVKQPAFFIC